MKIISKFQNSGKLLSKDNKEQEREQIIINPNDKFLYHRDFADVYENNEGKRYYVYDEDKIPTTSYNQSRQNLEKPLYEHIQKQYRRNPQGMKTIEDAVKWGGDVAGLSLATVGLSPYFLPRVAPTVVNGAKNFFKFNEWLFNPTTYRGAALTSAFAANEMNNFVNNPNFENGFWAGLSTIPLAKPVYAGAKATYNGIKNSTNKALESIAKTGNNYARSKIISKELNQQIKNFDGTVSENYFNSPYNWYRITNTPEVYGIKEVGKNVTTRDSGVLVDVPSDNWRISVLEQPLIRDKEGFLMLDPNRHNQSPRLFQKTGSAHGNTSQASKGQIWQKGISNSSMFPTVILEGQAARQVPMGITRTNFKLTPWEDIPIGQRIGFHTGEMPIEGLRSFIRLNNGKYRYDGFVIPYKISEFTPYKNIPYVSTYFIKGNTTNKIR